MIARVAGISGRRVELRAWPLLAELFGYGAVGSTLDEIGRALIACEADHLVFGARQPDPELYAHLARLGARCVVPIEDPRRTVAALMLETNVDPASAARAVANSCPFLMEYTALANALTLRAETAAADPPGAVLAIAQYFGISIDSAIAAAIAEEFGGSAAAEPAEPDSELPPSICKTVDGMLLPYSRWFAGGRIEQITWTRELFHLDGVVGATTQPVDLAGRSRILIYGPYIQLPAGSWTAQVVLGFCPDAAESTYLVDAFAGEQLAATTFQPSRPGVYTAELTFSLGQPGGMGVEIRVMVLSDDAKGQLALGHVILNPLLTRLPQAEPRAVEDFAAVLEL